MIAPKERVIEVWRHTGVQTAAGHERAGSSAINGFELVPAELFAPPRA